MMIHRTDGRRSAGGFHVWSLPIWGSTCTSMLSIADIGALATAAGVAFAALQVAAQRVQFRTAFQDDLWREQRQVIARLPVALTMMSHDDDAPFDATQLGDDDYRTLFRYFDLCNEQAFLADRGRIGRHTWAQWRQNIESTMRRPAFAHAWAQIGNGRAQDEFEHLAAVLNGTHAMSRRRDLLGRSRGPATPG